MLRTVKSNSLDRAMGALVRGRRFKSGTGGDGVDNAVSSGVGKGGDGGAESEVSALTERFQALAESSIDSSSYSSIKNNPELQRILQKYGPDSAASFESKYQSQISYVKSETLLARNKHAKEISDTVVTPAWTGTESVRDSNLRMIIDTAPKKMRITTPPTPIRERIHNAKEGSLDYKLAKLAPEDAAAQKDKEEQDNFKELYKERLLGPMMFMNSMSSQSGIGLISSMADVRINESINRQTGKFDDHPEMENVRGKPLSREHLANCTDTNYFMNQILRKEECLPPWIESQQGVNGDIERLRFDLDKTWSLKVLEILDKRHPSASTDELVELVRTKYQKEHTGSSSLFDANYHTLKMRYLEASVKDINMRITTYNLSSPSPDFHKWKLVPENEIKKSYERVLSNLDTLVSQRRSGDGAAASTASPSAGQADVPPPKIGFLSAVKSLVSSF